jgi:hypothetical protein
MVLRWPPDCRAESRIQGGGSRLLRLVAGEIDLAIVLGLGSAGGTSFRPFHTAQTRSALCGQSEIGISGPGPSATFDRGADIAPDRATPCGGSRDG